MNAPTDAPAVCRPGVILRAGACACALFLLGFLYDLWTSPHPFPFELLATSLLFCALLLTPAAWAFRSHFSADADGFGWRTTLGRARRVPWSDVLAIEAIGPADKPAAFRVHLEEDEILAWPGYWSGAQRLHDHVRARLDRAVYRSVGDRLAHREGRQDFVAPWKRADWWAPVGVTALAVVGLAVFGHRSASRVDLHLRGLGDLIFRLTVLLVAFGFPLLAVARRHWIYRREACDEVLVLSHEGLAVTGGPAPFRAAWKDVVSLTPLAVGGVTRVRLVTTAGEFVVPGQTDDHLLMALLAHAPPEAVDAWHRADAVRRGDVATPLEEGARRHRFRLTNARPWTVDAVVLLALSLPALRAMTQRPDDAALALPSLDHALQIGLGVLAVVLHRGARAYLGVTVSPSGVAWSGPWYRRRFAWTDVAAVNFPGPLGVLTLRLSDGTRLRCWPALLAGSLELLAALREGLADVPPGDA